MRIAVTGGSGFIGGHVVRAAARRGHEVRSLSRRPAAGEAPAGVASVAVDLRTGDGLAEAISGCDAVVHCAAAMGGDLTSQTAVTVDGTRHLLQAMMDAGVRRLVGISSFAVYDMLAMPEDALLDEDAPLELHPERRAPYIRVKLEQEALIRDRGKHVDFTILRPGLVFGPQRTWFHHLGVRGPGWWLCLSPDATLPLTHVGNCADAIVCAAESTAFVGRTLNVVDDRLPSRREYMSALRTASGAGVRILEVPWPLLREAARTGSGVNERLFGGRLPTPDLLQPASLHARCKPLRYGNARLKALGWRPEVDWLDGLNAAERKT
jgi:nucleoside-diphosphate-sugar epimerase